MRGKDDLQKLFAVSFGITPAYAGKSSGKSQGQNRPEDHPRLCGEKKKYKRIMQSKPRITPAYAGKSHFDTLFRFFVTGSPPPMRGKAYSWCAEDHSSRITPAYAGKS